MSGIRLDGRAQPLERPPDWDDEVVDVRLRKHLAIGDTVLARVEPRRAGFRGRTVASRKHRSGWGLWRAEDGRFERWADQRWGDVVVLGSGELLVSLYFERAVEKLSWPALESRGRCVFALPQLGIEHIVLSPSERFAILVLNSGQGEAGFELLEVATMTRGDGLPGFTLPVMYSPPAFTPDETRIIAVSAARGKYNGRWWLREEEEEDEEATAPGGPMPLAKVWIHDLRAGRCESDEVHVEVPAGWSAPDPDHSSWQLAALVSVDDRRIELGLGEPLAVRYVVDLPIAGPVVVAERPT